MLPIGPERVVTWIAGIVPVGLLAGEPCREHIGLEAPAAEEAGKGLARAMGDEDTSGTGRLDGGDEPGKVGMIGDDEALVESSPPSP